MGDTSYGLYGLQLVVSWDYGSRTGPVAILLGRAALEPPDGSAVERTGQLDESFG